MTDAGVYAVNAHTLNTDPLRLVEICIDKREDIVNFFHVLAKGIDNDEWYLRLNRSEIETSEHPRAKEILEAVKSIGDFLAKGAGDEETSKRIHEEVWHLTWVW